MKILIGIGYIFLGLGAAGFAWLWAASLISHACNMWWKAREEYRRHMDNKVSELLDDQVN